MLWADRLEGPWILHPANPIKMDVRSSRNGGSIFRVADQLIRPAQDCSRTYGGALILNRILECTPERYREEPIARLLPDELGPFPAGVHTLSCDGKTIWIDGKKFVFDPSVVLQRIRRRVQATRIFAR